MKQLIIALIAMFTLAACSPESHEEPVLLIQPNLTAVASVPAAASAAEAAAAAVSSPIVAQILSASEEADVITSSKLAMASVSASDIAAASAAMLSEAETVFVPEDDLPEVSLPETCERYYKRVDSCFAKQSENSEELRLMNQEARVDLAADKPTNKACELLNQSFDAVAQNLACE